MSRDFKIYICSICMLVIIFPFLTIKTEESKAKEVFNILDESTADVNLVLDSDSYKLLPKEFRSTSDLSSLKKDSNINLSGLSKLNMSGSSQFSEQNFLPLLKKINTPLNKVIIDLRQESHGFINGSPVYWHNQNNDANKKLTENEVLADENSRFNSVKLDFPISFYNHPNISIIPQKVETEEKFVASRELSYIRIPVTKNQLPTDKMVDYFVKSTKEQPVDIWIHFHCRNGIEATTKFMIMYDMMKNYDKATADEIIERQMVLANFDAEHKKLFTTSKTTSFLNDFYKYCKQSGNKFNTSWSKWKEDSNVSHKKLSFISTFLEVASSYSKNCSIPVFFYWISKMN